MTGRAGGIATSLIQNATDSAWGSRERAVRTSLMRKRHKRRRALPKQRTLCSGPIGLGPNSNHLWVFCHTRVLANPSLNSSICSKNGELGGLRVSFQGLGRWLRCRAQLSRYVKLRSVLRIFFFFFKKIGVTACAIIPELEGQIGAHSPVISLPD